MGQKYMIYAFNYPFQGYTHSKQTRWLIIAIGYVIAWSIKYDGVDLNKRG